MIARLISEYDKIREVGLKSLIMLNSTYDQQQEFTGTHIQILYTFLAEFLQMLIVMIFARRVYPGA